MPDVKSALPNSPTRSSPVAGTAAVRRDYGRVAAITPINTKNPKKYDPQRDPAQLPDCRHRRWALWLETPPDQWLGAPADTLSRRPERPGPGLEHRGPRCALASFFAQQKYSDRNPVRVELPDQRVTQLALEFLGERHLGNRGSPEFWDWFRDSARRQAII